MKTLVWTILQLMLAAIGLCLCGPSEAQISPVIFPNVKSDRDGALTTAAYQTMLDDSPSLPDTSSSDPARKWFRSFGPCCGLDTIRDQMKERRRSVKASMIELRMKSYAMNRTSVAEADRMRLKIESAKLDSALENLRSEVQEYFTTRDNVHRIFYHPISRGGLVGLGVRQISSEYFYDGYSSDPERAQGGAGIKILKNNLITYSAKAETASLFSELAYDYFGPIRLGVGVLIGNKQSASTDSIASDTTASINDQVQRLVGGGGNGVLSFGLPIIGFSSLNNRFSFRLHYAPKLGFDFPKIGIDTNQVAQNFDNGAELVFVCSGIKNTLAVFGQVRYGHISGNSQFYRNLNRGSDHGLDLWQVSAGLAVNSQLRFVLSSYFGDDYIRKNFNFRFGVQLVPNN